MPKQDKVKRMNQRRIAPTDRLGLGAAVAGGGSAPGSLDVSTSNNAADPHTHEIIADWDPRIAEALLKTNPNGWSNLVRLYLDELYAEAGQDLVIRLGDNAGARNLSIEDSDAVEVASIDSDGLLSVRGMASAGDLLPTVAATYDLGSEELPWKKLWANEFEFGEIDGDLIPTLTDTYDIGSASKLWRRGYLSELDTFLLVENAISVIGGIQVIGHGQGTLAVALGDGVDDTQIDVGEGTNLAAGDFVLLRASLAVEYLEIVSDDGDGLFTVDRDVDGSGRNTWPQGAVWVNLGQTGDGRIELAASTTPRISIALQGAAYNLTDEILRIGDLNGSFGIGVERYGFAIGDATAGNYLIYDTVNGFLLQAGDGEVQIDETGITIGYDAAAAFRLEADAGGTKHDVMYHDDEADALHIESATQYWELMEYQGAKLAADGGFFKFQERENSELADNGGFETAGSGGEVFDSWTFSGTDGSVTDETGSVHAGSHAAKITSGATKDARIAQTVSAPFSLAGYTVVLSFWTRGDGSYAGRYRVWGNGYDGFIVGTTVTGVMGTAYTHVTTMFTCPAGTTSLIVTLLGPNSSGAHAMFDDVSVAIYWDGTRVALGSADDNFVVLGGQMSGYGPALRLQLDDTPDDYGRSLDMRFVGHYISDANADPPVTFDRATPQVTFVSVDVPPASTCLFLQGVKYLGVALYVFNVTDGKAQGHVFTEIGWQGYDYVSVYSTSDPTKAGETTGECYVRLYENNTGSNRYAGDAILRNGNATKTMRFVGWVTYMTA
jgi:hypothetical protein